jgi:hypothetical protein
LLKNQNGCEIESAMTPNAVVCNWLIPKANAKRGSAILLSDEMIDWPETIRAAGEDFSIPALATMLDQECLLDCAPHDVQQFLRYAVCQNVQANRQIREQCLEIGKALSAAGLYGVLLKGACWLFEDGPAAQDRMLRDIDLLVPRVALDEVGAVLGALGYKTWSGVVPEIGHIHDPPLEHPDRRASVEIHVELTPWVRYLSADEVLAQAIPVAPGLCVPLPLHRLVHNVVHAQIANGDFVGGRLGLRDSLDVARLMQKDIPRDDWMNLARTARERRLFRPLSAALHKATHVSGAPLPEPFRSDPSGRRHLQRCLWQRRWPRLESVMRRLGVFLRATAWERDAYALGLGSDHGLAAHLLVNLRRLERIRAALQRGPTSA